MAHSNINHVVISGNLTRDPDIKQTNSGTSVAELGVAVNTNIKKDGIWESKPNYFQVTVWGKQAELCSQYLQKGSKITVDGRLEWQSWENKEGNKNSRVVIIAQQIEFVSNTKGKSNSSGNTTATAESEPDEIF